MNINKFTLAAALSIGIMASTAYAGLTEDFTADASSNALAACPCACPTPITPQTAGCPCNSTPAQMCPTCGCNPCKCNPCQTSSCDSCNSCNTCQSCNPCATPTCAVCPKNKCCDKFKQQVYAYPNAIYGGNYIAGEQANSSVIGTPNLNQANNNMNAWMTCGCGDITGSACDIPTMGVPSCGLNSLIPSTGCGCGCATGGAVPFQSPSCGCGCQGVAVSRPLCGCASPLCDCGNASSSCGCGCNSGCAAPACGCDSGCAAPACGCDTGCAAPACGCGCVDTIQTETSTVIKHNYLVPFQVPCAAPCGCNTGCAAPCASPITSAFEDVPSGFWAGCDINKLTSNNIIAGYPDRTFKPNLPVSRAEMASLIIKGYNLSDKMSCPSKTFRDVPLGHWANSIINTAVANGMMCGYPNGMFKPNQPVSRAEALTILSKGINCPMDGCKAQEVLSKYCDACSVPSWATIPIAKALEAGANCDSPQANVIAPNKDASRAEIASMLENVRVAIGYSKDDKVSAVTDADGCPCETAAPCATSCAPACSNNCPTGCATYMVKEECVQIPTLKICFADEINSRSANVGDHFAAKTVDPVTINGQCYPCGSNVYGQVTEVIRPGNGCNDNGALRLTFNSIEGNNCGCGKVNLPNQVLTAQVCKEKTPNIFQRIVSFPFTLVGGLIGDTGRTVGGALISLTNATEQVFDEVGVGTSELFMSGGNCCGCKTPGRFSAAGRSYLDGLKAAVMAPVDVVRTALSGTMGLFQQTGSEITYLIDANGNRVSAINPRESVTIAFGCKGQR